MIPFRDRMANKAVKKTLTIPKWLDDLAAENHVNYSLVLQEALKRKLDVMEPRGASGWGKDVPPLPGPLSRRAGEGKE